MASVAELMSAFNKAAKKTVGAVGLAIPDPPRLPSDIFALDLACGGGFPQGRAVVIYGLEAAMKTTVSLKLIAMSQKLYPEKRCVFIDVEGHLSQKWAELYGVNWSELMYILPESGDQVVDMMEGMVQAEDVGVIVLDSIAALVTQQELGKSAEQMNVGTQGLLINKLYRKMGHAFNESKRMNNMPTAIFINQIRYKMVMMGNPETTPGGPSINLYLSSLTLRLKGEDVFLKKTDKLPTYRKITVTFKKWKVPVLSRNCEFMIAMRDIPELGIKNGQSYSWNTVLIYLKKLEMLTQVKDGWQLDKKITGINWVFNTQDEMKDKYQLDNDFGMAVRKAIIERALADGDPIESTEEVKE
jgi:recombination protein RecA